MNSLIIVIIALAFQAIKYVMHKDIALLMISILLMILAGFMVYEVVCVIFTRRARICQRA